MFEEILAIRVTERPYAWLRRFQIFVDCNPSIRRCLYSRLFRMKDVRYWSSSAGDHYLPCRDRHRLPSLAVESNQLLQALRDFSHFLHFMVGDDIDVSTQHLLCQGRDFSLFLGHERAVSPYDRVLRPHAGQEAA